MFRSALKTIQKTRNYGVPKTVTKRFNSNNPGMDRLKEIGKSAFKNILYVFVYIAIQQVVVMAFQEKKRKDEYSGDLDENKLMHGQGTLKHANGDKYDGTDWLCYFCGWFFFYFIDPLALFCVPHFSYSHNIFKY
jgi:hypothetical protein